MPACAGHHVGADLDRAVRRELEPGHAAQKAAVGLLAERQHHRVGGSVSNSPVGCGRPSASRSIRSTVSSGPAISLIVVSHLILTPSSMRLVGLELVRRHVGAVAAVDDQRLVGAQPPGGAGGVHRRVAAAIDDDPAAEQRRLAGAGARAARDTASSTRTASRAGMSTCLADAGADGDEHRVEPASLLLGQQVVDLVVGDDLDAHRLDARDLAGQLRRAAGGRRECRNASCRRAAARLRGFRRHGRAAPDDRRPTGRSGRRRRPAPSCRVGRRARRERPALRAARSPRKRSTAWMPTGASIAPRLQAAFAGVIADPAVHGGHRIVADKRSPRPRGICPAWASASQPWMFSPAGQALLQGGSRST